MLASHASSASLGSATVLVRAQHMRKDYGVCKAVRYAIAAAQAVGDSVHVPHVATRKGYTSLIGGLEHIGPRLDIIAVYMRLEQVVI